MVATAGQWWEQLSALNQCFFVAAGFFSLLFLWQMIASLIGAGGGEGDFDVDVDVDAGADFDAGDLHLDDGLHAHDLDGDASGAETVEAFRLFSIRAIMAFCLLFCWAAALYLENGRTLGAALSFAILWGLAGWVIITLLVNALRRLNESGNARLETAVGAPASVYADIPPGGAGQVRVKVSGVISVVAARSSAPETLAAGTPVRVVRLLDSTTLEVTPAAASRPADVKEKA